MFPKYPKYKPSGTEWLGEIPEHWEVIRVKSLEGNKASVVQTGPFGAQLHAHDYVDEGVPLILIRNVGDMRIDDTDIPMISQEDAERLSMYRLKAGDIVFSRVGSIGRIALCSDREHGWLISGQMLRLRITNPRLYHKFAVYAFGCSSILTFVELQSVGSTRESVNTDILRNMPLPIPPEDEQRAISAFLDQETAQIDELIKKKERQIELLQEKRTALISHAVTKGLNPNVKMKPSEIEWLGDIPEHWEVKSIKHLSAIQRGKFSHRPRNDPRFYGGAYPFIQTGDISAAGKFIRTCHQTLNDEGLSISKVFPKGTLVMSIAANIGDIAILGFDACFPDSIVGFLPSRDVDLDFYYYALFALRDEMINASTINTQLNINIERIGSVKTVLPPLPEQRAIAAFLDQETARIDALIEKIRKSIDLLREYRTALITAAVTGKIDVRLAAAENAAQAGEEVA